MTTDIETVLRTLQDLLAQISEYKGHGNPGCPNRVGAYMALQKAKMCLHIHGIKAQTYDEIHP